MENKTVKTSRTDATREKTKRAQPWRPPSSLEAPPAPAGFKHRWIRAETLGTEDRKNMAGRLREGFELVRADEFPDFHAPTIENGTHAGVIGVGGLLLARIPEEIVEQRKNYFENKTQTQMDAVDRDWMRENNPVMPKLKPQRSSNVSFGNNRNLNDD